MNETLPISFDEEPLRVLCQRWKITELSLFGSVLRDDFGPEADVDVLITFEPRAPWSLLDLARAQRELASLVGRPVDLLTRRSVEQHTNPWTKHLILSSAQTLFRAA